MPSTPVYVRCPVNNDNNTMERSAPPNLQAKLLEWIRMFATLPTASPNPRPPVIANIRPPGNVYFGETYTLRKVTFSLAMYALTETPDK